MSDMSQTSHRAKTRRKSVRSSLVASRGPRRETASARSSGENMRERVLAGVSGKRKRPSRATGMAASGAARVSEGAQEGREGEDALAAPVTRNWYCQPLMPCTPLRFL